MKTPLIAGNSLLFNKDNQQPRLSYNIVKNKFEEVIKIKSKDYINAIKEYEEYKNSDIKLITEVQDFRSHYWELAFPNNELFKVFYFRKNIGDKFIKTHYQISNFGRVYDMKRKSFCAIGINTSGYPIVKLNIKGKRYVVTVHKMVAETFVGVRTQRLCEINHIDGDKRNPIFYNLELTTHGENIQHAVKTGLFKPKGNYLKGDSRKNGFKYSEETIENFCKYASSCGETTISELFEKFPNINKEYLRKIINKKERTDISSKYDFSNVKLFNETCDENTIKIICEKLNKNISIAEISRDTRINRTTIGEIKAKRRFKDISNKYLKL